jgi:addiction module HigA family antidote
MEVTMPMKNPPHPGLSVRLDCLEPLGLSVTKGAEALGVTRQALNNLVNGKAGISPEMAIRLAKAFGSNSETWLAMQMAYDLAQARQHEGEIKVQRVARPALAHLEGEEQAGR